MKKNSNLNWWVIIAVGFGTAVAVAFVIFAILKLLGIIDWSWWWITSPIWIPWCLSLVALIIALLYYAFYTIRELFNKKRGNHGESKHDGIY